MWFSKQVTSINDPHGDIIKPDSTMMLDYEVELAFVIGKECYQVSALMRRSTYSATRFVMTLA